MFPSIPLFNAAVVSQPFKRAQLGLFQGKTKQYGNNVPFSKHKTRRTWLPNVQSKRLFSDSLQEFVKVKLTTRALKTVKKHGGLDNYVLKTKPDLLGWEGMRIRVAVREKQREHGTGVLVRPTPSTHTTAETVEESRDVASAV
ncbi:39S ribosomal protein L24, mitochondrial [Steccherinum ochraceum]|uniref:Large ribosomal subunit protein bL28c n=1 Tax=Steccherinum ochraceum TaxID=92696 RepID=A0A4R0RFJ9_9APHY|nr:39S ribosomal protein L24, mitochondrial [Steccherinum ochraceum]